MVVDGDLIPFAHRVRGRNAHDDFPPPNVGVMGEDVWPIFYQQSIATSSAVVARFAR